MFILPIVSLSAAVLAVEIAGVPVTKSGDRSRKCTWLCPCVTCPTIPDDCQNSETFIFEYNYFDQTGKLVEIRCESCRYCLDLPDGLNKRSLDSDGGIIESAPMLSCGIYNCPNLLATCADSRLTDVYVKETKCGICPACYDHIDLSQILN